ncbi:beta-ketoacyl synthase N-terminal-like domain-containing protein [Streptomyces sp. NPDC048301]|uniref:beta-ketoacyl synthase N-terminal-like domain-containing protein n=1 Tax=Streptomyces sp. NPDC048301 TaxID=3155631 RepID=UPI00343A8ACD
MSAAPVTSPAPHGRRAAGDLVFSAWSAVSPFGPDSESYGSGLRRGESALHDVDQETWPGPYTRAATVPGFSAAEALGKKGTRTMDRVTALAVTTVGRLMEACGPDLAEHRERTGLVLGTGSGSVQSIMDFTRDSLTGDKPYHVDPARFPNTVMNRATGQSAIWHGIKGPNTTIAGGWLTGLLALSYAARLFRGGHCDRVLCGAAEEYSVQRAWLEWHSAKDGSRPALGEGGAAWLLETEGAAHEAGRTPLARLRATRFRTYHAPGDAAATLTRCVQDALADAGVTPSEVGLVAPLGTSGEEEAVRAALGAREVRWLRVRPLLGDTSAAATGFQTAAVLAASEDGLLPSGTAALITGIDRDGTVGCAVLTG